MSLIVHAPLGHIYHRDGRNHSCGEDIIGGFSVEPLEPLKGFSYFIPLSITIKPRF